MSVVRFSSASCQCNSFLARYTAGRAPFDRDLTAPRGDESAIRATSRATAVRQQHSVFEQLVFSTQCPPIFRASSMFPRSQNSISRTLWSGYRPPLSETLRHPPSSQSVATSVFERRGCLLPILATRCEKPSQTVCDRKRHTPATQPSAPTQLRVKPATAVIVSRPTAYISANTVNTANVSTKPSTYTPTATAVNVTTDTACRNANARTTGSTYATTIVSVAHSTKDEGDEKGSTEGENAEGEWMRGGQRDKTGGTRRKAGTTAQNDDDKRSYRPEHIPRMMDGHRDSNPIPATHVNPIPVAINTFATWAPRNISALRSGNKNPWGSLSRRHHRTRPCENNSPAPIRVFEKVYHPHGIGLTKPVFRAPIRTHIVTPLNSCYTQPNPGASIAQCHSTLANSESRLTYKHFLDNSSLRYIIPSHRTSSTFITDTHSTPLKTFLDILSYALTFPSPLFSVF
jgi:hypothetical protein